MKPIKVNLYPGQTYKIEGLFKNLKGGDEKCGVILAQVFPCEINEYGIVDPFMSVVYLDQGKAEKILDVIKSD